MKTPIILRPKIPIHFVGVEGFFKALQGICRAGLIRKSYIDLPTKYGSVERIYFYIAPKFKLKRVARITDCEVDT